MKLTGAEQVVMERVDRLRDEMFDLLTRLVAEASVLGQEVGALDVMEQTMQRMGLDPARIFMDDSRLLGHPEYARVPGVPRENRYNLVAVHPAAGQGGKSCLMNGHLDVVPPGPEDMWTSSPFEPRIKDGWMYGRGSGDMKAGVAAMTTALRAVMESGFGLGADVVLETVIEEENSGNGALACRAAGYDARAVLIPEPFGPTILTAQLGVLWFKVIVQGRPTHVLQTGSGANAIEKCVPVIHSLRCLEEAMNQEPKPGPWSDMAHPVNLNVGRITGGDWPSTVPAKAQFEARLSFYPGQDYESVAQRIRESVVQAARQDPWLAGNPPRVEFFGFRSQGHMVENRPEPFQVLGACHQSLKGDRPESYVAACTTDLRSFFLHGPARGTCFGPVAENIHGLDERVLLESVVHTARVYALFLARWCKLIS